MNRPGVRKVLECSGEQRQLGETVCEVICGATITPAVEGQVKVKNILMHNDNETARAPIYHNFRFTAKCYVSELDLKLICPVRHR